jgi:hypothetical protein
MVNAMDSERRKAWNEARAEAYEVSLARHITAPVEKPAPAPVSRLTDAEILRLEMQTRELLSEHRLQELVDSRVEAAFEARQWQHEATLEAVGDALGKIRAQLRSEIAAEVGSLRADISIEKAHAVVAERVDHGEVVDMLVPMRSQRRA